MTNQKRAELEKRIKKLRIKLLFVPMSKAKRQEVKEEIFRARLMLSQLMNGIETPEKFMNKETADKPIGKI